MFKKRKSSFEIDTTIKLNSKLIEELIDQFEKFDLLKNDYLLNELEKILQFKNEEIRSTNESKFNSEIKIYEIKEIMTALNKFHLYNKLINPSDYLKTEIEKIKQETVEKLILLPSELNLNNRIEDNLKFIYSPNESDDQSNYNDTINEPVNKMDETTINESKNNDEIIENIFKLIFNYLPINDLLNCRLVNKQFKYFSDHTNGLNRLIIGQPNLDFDDYYWYCNNKSLDDNDIISLKCFRSIKSIFNLVKNLKYLKICDQQFELKDFSDLINLESLEFGYDLNRKNQQIINLKNLKVFVSNNLRVKLNSPKLIQIQFYDINQIQLDSNPESIKHLIAINYQNKFEIFKNLEIIELMYADLSINENLLIIFKNLKQFKIKSYSFLDNSIISEIKNKLIRILNDKIKLNREFDIYIGGVKIKDINKFNKLKSKRNSIWKFRLNNYNLLDLNLSFIHLLYYEELEECFENLKNDLPSTFFDRFQNIHHVEVYSVNEVDGLNWFLNNLKYLVRLKIGFISLGEVFYNNLPNTIRELNIWNKEDINYGFILKLTKLINFFTEADKDLFILAFKSFLNLKYLEYFSFYFKGKHIAIKKRGKNFYLKHSYKKFELNYNQLIVECNKIRSK